MSQRSRPEKAKNIDDHDLEKYGTISPVVYIDPYIHIVCLQIGSRGSVRGHPTKEAHGGKSGYHGLVSCYNTYCTD